MTIDIAVTSSYPLVISYIYIAIENGTFIADLPTRIAIFTVITIFWANYSNSLIWKLAAILG